ncbi:methyltransferase domain-containing protein [archaeon]|nr:methyltransferase domain-containing protein [archaeon]
MKNNNRVKEYFSSKSTNYNKNKLSGFWGYLARKETIAIKTFLNLQKDDYLLDAGCGSGFYTNILSNICASVYGVDISENMIKQYKAKGFKGEVADLESLSLKKEFNKILCAGALEFCDDPNKVMESFSKHLILNGEMILIYPHKNFLGFMYKLFHQTHNICVNLFNKAELIELFHRNGLEFVSGKKVTLISSIITARKIK